MLNDGIHRLLSQAEVFGELRQIGVVLEPPFVLTLLAIPAKYLPSAESDKDWIERQHSIDQLIDFLHESKAGVVWQTPDGIAIIQMISGARSLPVSVGNAKLSAMELMKTISRCWLDQEVRVGISHSTEEVQNIADLFEQARAALVHGPVLETGGAVHHWHDLGCLQFIVKDLQSAQVRQFVQEHLGAILNKKHSDNCAQELATLKAIVSGDSFQVIADRLHVHKQTVVFRKKKLEDTLEVDLDRLETRMNLSIAMKLLSLIR